MSYITLTFQIPLNDNKLCKKTNTSQHLIGKCGQNSAAFVFTFERIEQTSLFRVTDPLVSYVNILSTPHI